MRRRVGCGRVGLVDADDNHGVVDDDDHDYVHRLVGAEWSSSGRIDWVVVVVEEAEAANDGASKVEGEEQDEEEEEEDTSEREN